MKPSGSAAPEIVYCDNHLLIAVKPPNMLTQPDDTGRESLESICKAWVKEEFNKPGNVFLHAIHRLDRPVSGLVLFARTSKALSRMNELSRAREISRFYTAEVEGIVSKKEGKLEHYLIHGDHNAILGKPNQPEAKKAVLFYKVKQLKEHTTIVTIELETGRYHQIRAQFSVSGHPVVGDIRYKAKNGNGDEIHLACTEVSFIHPVTKEPLKFHSSPFF